MGSAHYEHFNFCDLPSERFQTAACGLTCCRASSNVRKVVCNEFSLGKKSCCSSRREAKKETDARVRESALMFCRCVFSHILTEARFSFAKCVGQTERAVFDGQRPCISQSRGMNCSRRAAYRPTSTVMRAVR
ncbi:hypothetical protein CSUI_009319 [Cystoisospora suis]|uniref:Uncharacterized protein n=1 Tax=Cystoisospora suis TaxID=483139 RepID=A0A2C6KK57_9APIC|nr:hypothetical protein CSUI_009319 [Cystoisospora suis]